jgi:hypothetical protein
MRATLNWLAAGCLLAAGCSTGGQSTTSTTTTPAPAPGDSTIDASVQRVVCQWHSEQTPDGRTIQVPTYYLVDEQGRVVRRLKGDEVK